MFAFNYERRRTLDQIFIANESGTMDFISISSAPQCSGVTSAAEKNINANAMMVYFKTQFYLVKVDDVTAEFGMESPQLQIQIMGY